jgi:ribosomal protein S18 acetylase RimI-like enzyme
VSSVGASLWNDAVVELERFDPAHAELIAGWPADAAECLAWCSAESVSGADVAAWSATGSAVDGSADGRVEAWVLAVDGVPVAYGEVWFDDEEGEAELAHVIVAPTQRSIGLGRQLVNALAERGAERYATVVMRVAPDNESAQRCYAAAGFVRVSASEEAEWNIGQPQAYRWMRR